MLRKNGFVFDIRTGEQNHANTAHVHVKWTDEEITVRLDNYAVKRKKRTDLLDERKAVKIIKEYEKHFNDAWKEIIENHDAKKAMRIFDELK